MVGREEGGDCSERLALLREAKRRVKILLLCHKALLRK